MRRGTAKIVAFAAGAWAAGVCGCDTTGPEDVFPAGLRVIAGAGVEDTIEAELAQALVVEVRDASGRPLSGVALLLEADSTRNVQVARLEEGAFWTGLQDTTDARGRVAVQLRLGHQAGPAGLTVAAPSLGLQAAARFEVRAGAPAIVDVQPADTAVYVGRTFAARGAVRDRFGNPRPEAVTYAVPAAVLAVSVDGATVRGEHTGRGYVVSRFGAAVDTAWVSVVPEGLIAAFEEPVYYNSSGLDVRQPPRVVLLGLDGSGFRVLHEEDPPEIPGGLQPRWSPDGDAIAMVQWGQLWVVDTSGATRRVLAGPPAVSPDCPPEYSPDGRWIYFFTRAADSTGIWRVRSDGSGVEKTAADSPQPASASLSPTGDRFVYQKAGPILAILDLATGTSTSLPVFGQQPRWSPTGEWIAHLDRSGRLFLVRPDGTDRRPIGTGVPAYAIFAWSPDAQWLIVAGRQPAANDEFGVGLSLVNIASGDVLPLRFGHHLLQPSWRR